jgi:hypothetical protein
MFHKINWSDLEFQRVPVGFRSTAGVPQIRLARVGMPRIPQDVINGVFYLYGSKDEALAGRNPGGTGFIIRYDGTLFEAVPGHHFYGVTNWHVACDRGSSTIRLNTKDGRTDIIEQGPEDWHFLPGKYDVAVVPLSLDDKIHDVSSVSTHQFAEEPKRQLLYPIGVGDDVFMIGLFVDHDGITTNVPSARFGNISMLANPKATIKQETGYRGESYVVDMHSRTGFSGSPVYVYRTFGSDLTAGFLGYEFEALDLRNQGGRLRGRLRAHNLFQLLGIHWGQFPEKWELRDKPKLKESRKDLIVEGGYVEGMSGMTCVIPAWQIMEVLEMPALKSLRHPRIVAARRAETSSMQPKPESVPQSGDANPTHQEDFRALLTAAVKKNELKD